MNIVDVLRVLRNNRWVILACVALGTLLGVAYSLLQPVLYTATSTGLVVVQGEATLSGTETAQTRAKSYVPLINSRTVREKVADTTGTDPAAAQLKGAVVPDSNLIEVQGTASSPEEAARIANSALVATAEVANDLDPESTVRVTAMEDALPPGSPSSPDYLRNALYGLGAGVWSRDGNTAYRAGRAIQAGRVWVNNYHNYPAHAAFGGYKASGIGRENHKMMLEHYQQTKSMLVSYSPDKLGFF